MASGDAETEIARRPAAAGRCGRPRRRSGAGCSTSRPTARWSPDDNPSLVRTPLVIAMWEPMADALGWPRKPLGFADLLRARALRRGLGRLRATRSSARSSSSTRTPTSRPRACRPSRPSTTRRRASARGSRGPTWRPAGARERPRPRALDRPLRRHDAVHLRADAPRRARVRVGRRDGGDHADRLQPAARRPAAARGDLSAGGHVLLRQPVHRARRRLGDAGAAARRRALQHFLSRRSRPRSRQSGLPARRREHAAGAPIEAANGVDPAQPERVLACRTRVLARIKPAWREDRKPANVMLVLDTSGSMTEEAARAREGGRAGLLRPGGAQDRIGLMKFSDKARSARSSRWARARRRKKLSRRSTGCSPTAAPPSTTPWPGRSSACSASRTTERDQRGRAAHRRQRPDSDLDLPTSSSSSIKATRSTRCACSPSPTAPRRAAHAALKDIAAASGGGFYLGDTGDIETVYRKIGSYF